MIQNLKSLRTSKGISQQQLADIIGVSQQSINKYENHNVEPDIATLIRIADFFQTSVDFLIGHTEIRRKIEQTSSFDLNKEEAMVIQGFRLLNPKQRNCVIQLIECM